MRQAVMIRLRSIGIAAARVLFSFPRLLRFYFLRRQQRKKAREDKSDIYTLY